MRNRINPPHCFYQFTAQLSFIRNNVQHESPTSIKKKTRIPSIVSRCFSLSVQSVKWPDCEKLTTCRAWLMLHNKFRMMRLFLSCTKNTLYSVFIKLARKVLFGFAFLNNSFLSGFLRFQKDSHVLENHKAEPSVSVYVLCLFFSDATLIYVFS